MSKKKNERSFYQFASIFTDVPQLNKQVNKENGLQLGLNLYYIKTSNFLLFTYTRILRGNDYFGIYIRLGLIGAFALYFIPNIYVKGAITYIVLYMISMQLRSLWKYFSGNIIVALYPIDTENE